MDDDITSAHYDKLCQLQRLAFQHWPPLREMALASCGAIDKRGALKQHLAALSEDQLRVLVTRQLRLVGEDDPWAQVRSGTFSLAGMGGEGWGSGGGASLCFPRRCCAVH